MAIDRYNFTTDFQDELLHCMIAHPSEFLGLSGVIDFKYFTGSNSQLVCHQLQEFYREYNTYPTFAQLSTLCLKAARKSGDGEKALEIQEYVSRLSEVTIRAKEFYRDQCVSFAKQRALILAATNVAKLIQDGKEPGGDIVTQFQEALSIGSNLLDQGYLLRADYNEIIDKVTRKDYGTYTGYELFDQQVWRNGWGPGWLVVPLAPPKRFKTAFCLNLALNMVDKCGYDVLYYACEINAELASMRLFQAMIGVTQDQIFDDPGRIKEMVYKGMKKERIGDILIKHFPSKTATIADIRAHAVMAIENFGLKPKAIFIDYAETVKPDCGKDEPEYRQQSSIYTQARALGSELGCVVIMPDRCNREAVNQATPQMDSFQGAFEKAGIVDVSIGLCATDEEYEKGELRFFGVLNRHGEGGFHLRGKVDKARMRITVDKEMMSYDVAEVESQIRDQQEKKYAGRTAKGSRSRKLSSSDVDPRFDDEEISLKEEIASRKQKPPSVR